MNGDATLYICGALVLLVIIQAIGNVIVQRNLTHSIDILSDKIMARDYREYKAREAPKEEDASPKEDEPISWHDH